MTPLLFRNARIFDGTNAECAEGMYLRVSDGLIREVSPKPMTDKDARVIDVGGRTLMPGLIDAHMHAYCSDVSMQKIEALGEPYRTAHAIRMLGHALDCGFTTVRDIGGGDYSLAKAIADGFVRAPRFFYAGKVLSMTGGHGDFRPLEQKSHHHELCSCGIVNWACRMADGVDACIQAARDELRQGAHCIKIMGSGGVASPTDPIWMNQYREDEIRAIVNECAERRTYVAAHCHPASAIRRCIEFGVRSIEHGTLIDDDTARFAAERGAYIIPTMVVIFALFEMGRQLGFPAASQEKAEYAYKQALSGMDKMRRADGQHLPLMTIWLVPVDNAAAVVRADFEVDRSMNVAAVRYSRRLDPLKDSVEVILDDSKTIVNHRNGVCPFIEVESQSIVHIYGSERPYTRFRPRNAKQFGQQLRRSGFVS